jgi:hypothetical protein
MATASGTVILNVDADAVGHYAVTRALPRAGDTVVEAAMGAEALRLLVEGRAPDLVILPGASRPDPGTITSSEGRSFRPLPARECCAPSADGNSRGTRVLIAEDESPWRWSRPCDRRRRNGEKPEAGSSSTYPKHG